MTRQASEAAGNVPRLPILAEHEQIKTVGLLVVAGDRGLAGAFNSNAVRAGVAAGREHEAEGRNAVYYASGRRPVVVADVPRRWRSPSRSPASATVPRTRMRDGSPSG